MRPYLNPDISYFARTDFRDDRRRFGIYYRDLLAGGMLILGATGNGKSNTIKVLAYNDILHRGTNNRGGFCLIDAHNDLVREVYNLIPKHQKKDVIYLAPTDPNCQWGYNPLRNVTDPNTRALIASSILETFRKVWGEQSWGIRLEFILRQSLLLLLQVPWRVTFDDIPRLLLDKDYREKCIPHATNQHIRRFFEEEFPRYSKGDILPVLNKITSLLSIPYLRKVLVENPKQLSMTQIMQNKQIFLVNLSKSKIGTDGVALLGSFLISAMVSAGFARLDLPSHKRQPFMLYLDEAGLYTTKSIVNAVSELRKSNFNIVFGLQYLDQLHSDIRSAILSNVGSIVCFRLGEDAKQMEKIFTPVFSSSDFLNLERYHISLRLLINGRVTPNAFSATTLTIDDLNSS